MALRSQSLCRSPFLTSTTERATEMFRRMPRRRCHRSGWEEEGMALVIVLLVMLVVTVLSIGLGSQGLAQLPLARGAQDAEGARQAAQAGVEDYIAYLNVNATYWTNAAHNLTSWTPLPGGTNESFRYSADATTTARDGIITITASGCLTVKVVAGACTGAIQTIRVSIRRSGFLDDVYFTDHEILD